MSAGFRVSMNVRVVTTKEARILLPTEEYTCVVQPPPHYSHRPNVLAVQIESMAKIKFMNDIYARLGTGDRDVRRQLSGRDWTIEAVITEQVPVEDVTA